MNRSCVAFAAILMMCVDSNAALIGEYSTTTGALNFNYDGAEGNLAGIRLNSSVGGLVNGQTRDLNGTITGPLSVVNDQAPNFIEWGNLVGFSFDNASAGAVLPAGLGQADLEARYELLFRSLAAPAVDIAGTLNCDDCITLITPTPPPGDLDLGRFGRLVAAGGFFEAAITFEGGEPTAWAFSNQSIPNLFFATLDGPNVGIGVDLALAATIPVDSVISADLSISGPGGPFNYTLQFYPPEPSSVVLAAVGLMGLMSARRRGTTIDDIGMTEYLHTD